MMRRLMRLRCRWFDYHTWRGGHCRWCGCSVFREAMGEARGDKH